MTSKVRSAVLRNGSLEAIGSRSYGGGGRILLMGSLGILILMRLAGDIATCMYYTGIDPFTKQEVYVARQAHDRRMQRALLQFFKPDNYFEVRKALDVADRATMTSVWPQAAKGQRVPSQGEIMHISTMVIASLTITALGGSSVRAEPYWPRGKEWTTVTPAAAGMDDAKLAAAVKYAMGHNTKGLLVLHGGKIVAESYADGWDKNKAGGIASATKSMVSILFGIALNDKKFKSVDQPLVDFAPQLKGTDKEALTIRHLLTMTSGLSPRGAARIGRGETSSPHCGK